MPDEVLSRGREHPDGRVATILRTVGAVAVLVTGAVHLQQYLYWPPLPIISPLFVLNFAAATVISLGLLSAGGAAAAAARAARPWRNRPGGNLDRLLLISEHQPLFGFQEYGYRAAIVIALTAEGVAVVTLAAYLATRARGGA